MPGATRLTTAVPARSALSSPWKLCKGHTEILLFSGCRRHECDCVTTETECLVTLEVRVCVVTPLPASGQKRPHIERPLGIAALVWMWCSSYIFSKIEVSHGELIEKSLPSSQRQEIRQSEGKYSIVQGFRVGAVLCKTKVAGFHPRL